MIRVYIAIAAALALVGGAWWLHNHLVEQGVQQQVEADRKAYAKLQTEADLETGRLKGRAEAAEKAHAKEHDALNAYVADHPDHGGLCKRSSLPASASPKASASHGINAGTGPAPAGVQQVPDSNSDGEPAVDSRWLLRCLNERADRVSAQAREWQARR